MTRLTALALTTVLAAGLLVADEKTKPTDKQMKEKMIAVHRGDASPYAKAEKEATAEKPNWDELAKHLKALKDMAADNRAYGAYTAGKYTAGVAGLEKAMTDKDAALASKSFASLRQACASCHNYGGATAASEAQLRKAK